MAIKMVDQLKAKPTPISWGELYTALQQGVVDGAENNPPSLHTTHQYEVINYYSLDRHTAPPDVLLVGTETWEDLSDQEREWLQKAANLSLKRQKTLWRQAEREAMKVIKKAGVTVVQPEKSKFAEAVRPLYKRIQKTQPKVYDLLQRIRSLEVSDDS
jgi:TRAP-type C4-dicarboxylate transport system substrate-binding protein